MKKPEHYNRIDNYRRGLAILRLAEGIKLSDIEKELNVSPNTIKKIRDDNGDLITEIGKKLSEHKIGIQEKIIFKGLNLLNQKLDELQKDDKTRAETKLTELSGMIKTLFDKSQIEKGEPTAISKTTHEDIETKRLELIKTARLIEKGDIIELIESVDNSE